jgi:hypothetical protein
MSTPEGCQRFAFEVIGCDDKNAVWFWVGYIDHAQESSSRRAPEGDSRTFSTWPVFCGTNQNLLDFLFGNSMLIDVWYICSWIDEEANVHEPFYP